VALGKATLIGPRYGDFKDTAEKLIAAGGLRVSSRHDIVRDLSALLADSHAREEMARAGRAVIAREQGATARHAALLTHMLLHVHASDAKLQAGAMHA
jgi:3-deoxy-D-manno-octulosonic-acid transferase